MRWLRRVIGGANALARSERADRDLDEELRAYLETAVEEKMRRGLDREQAVRVARLELGLVSVESVKDRVRDVGWETHIESIWQDVRYALRGLRRAPGFTAAAVLTLAIGTGANVGIFSIIDHALFRPLPVPAPEQLVNLLSPGPKTGSTSGNSNLGPTSAIFSYPLFRDIQRIQTVFTDVAAQRDFEANVSFRGEASHEPGWLVSGSYFPVLGIQPAVGRLLTPDDDRVAGAHRVVVLSHEYWRTRFNAEPTIVNQTLVVNGQAMTILGVAPEGFVGTTLHDTPRIFVPVSMTAVMDPDRNGLDDRRDHWLYLFARLKPGISRENAEELVNVPFAALIRDVELPAQRSGLGDQAREAFALRRLVLEPGAQGQLPERAELSRLAVLLFSITGIVLLTACANVANLLLTRSVYRGTEFTVRMSVGAGRGRLVRQLLIECSLLAVLGVLGGAALAFWTVGALTPLLPGAATFRLELNATIYLFAALVAGGTVLLIGLYPALYGTRGRDLASGLKGAKTSAPAGTVRFSATLTTAQIALSLALVVLAGLFVQSFLNVSRLELGIQSANLLTFRVRPELSGYTRANARVLVERLERELAGLPGVTSVATSTIPLLDGFGWSNNVTVERVEGEHDSPSTADVGPGYFRTVGIPLVAGREFTEADRTSAPKVAIVNESFVRTFGLGRDALGRRMGMGAGNVSIDIEIVGVAADARYSNLKERAPAQFYLSYRQIQRFTAINFYVRSAGAPDAILPMISPLVAQVDRTLPVESLRTMDDQVHAAAATDRSMRTLSMAFAGIAILLTAIGLYGVLSYTVAQREREIGVRMALGADAIRIARVVFGRVSRMAIAGVIAGSAAALGLGRLAQSMLFGVEGPAPLVIAAAAIGVTAIALSAAAIPARRAVRVDPAVTLRAE
jgi:predicted permease